MTRSRFPIFLLIVSGIYLIWSTLFIYHSSFIAIDGHRYFSLLDDGMISMRYAWNLSHGRGLVWNPNEYIEGYSNLLLTLIMSLATAFFDKKIAVLAIQIFGILIVFTCACLTREIAGDYFRGHPRVGLFQNLSFVSVLFYYYLSFWTLLGMETGLFTALLLLNVLFIMRWIHSRNIKLLYLSSVAAGFAFLTRNEALIPSVLLFAFAFLHGWNDPERKKNLSNLFSALLLYGLFVVGLAVFRWFYYGELVPNTYLLKVSKIPYSVRINDGIIYTLAFLRGNIATLIFAILGVIYARHRDQWMFFTLFVASIIYSIWIGGDAWGGWRFFIPMIPLFTLLSISGVSWSSEKLAEKRASPGNQSRNVSTIATILITFLIVSTLNPRWTFIAFKQVLPDVQVNLHNMNVAIAIDNLTTDNATIGVFYAGLISYYTGRYSIDFLGKSDKYIAGLYPHLPEHIIWLQQPITTPGHNKYDLYYSIKKLQPDYIQRFYWAQQNIRSWAIQQYVRLEYQGAEGTVTLIVRKNSPHIKWEEGSIGVWGN